MILRTEGNLKIVIIYIFCFYFLYKSVWRNDA